MNADVLITAFGNIDDKYVREYFSFEQRRSRFEIIKRKKAFIAAACASVIIFSSIFGVFIYNHVNVDPTWYSMSNIEDVVVEGEQSRTGNITPATSDCWESNLSKEDLCAFFQHSDFDLFENKAVSAKYTVLRNGDGTVHTVRLKWQFKMAEITAIFDPINYPMFLFDGNGDKILNANGYDVVLRRAVIGEDFIDEIDVGIKKNNSGIWIISRADMENEIDELLNYIVNSNLDFEALDFKE